MKITNKINGRSDNISKMIAHVIENNIEGDILDIGVFKGFSSYKAVEKLLQLGVTNRDVYLYDTFEGMVKPTDEDGDKIKGIYKRETRNGNTSWAKGSLEEVKNNMESLKYPKDRIHYVKGMVEDTLLNHPHKKVAYMRLDTDYYSSTKIELDKLYPVLSPNGVVIVDDYGSKFVGSTLAVTEFLKENNLTEDILTRLPTCGVYFFKPI